MYTLNVEDQEIPGVDLVDALVVLVAPPLAAQAADVVILRRHQKPLPPRTPGEVSEQGPLDKLLGLSKFGGVADLPLQALPGALVDAIGTEYLLRQTHHTRGLPQLEKE